MSGWSGEPWTFRVWLASSSVGCAPDNACFCAQNERIWWLDAVVALVVTMALAIYSIPVLVRNRWWRRDFWKPYVGA